MNWNTKYEIDNRNNDTLSSLDDKIDDSIQVNWVEMISWGNFTIPIIRSYYGEYKQDHEVMDFKERHYGIYQDPLPFLTIEDNSQDPVTQVLAGYNKV